MPVSDAMISAAYRCMIVRGSAVHDEAIRAALEAVYPLIAEEVRERCAQECEAEADKKIALVRKSALYWSAQRIRALIFTATGDGQ